MQTDLQIVWEELEPSDFVKARIEREVSHLEKIFDRITSCKVFIQGPGHRHHQGGLYAVRVRLVLPHGKELVVARNPTADQSHQDAYVAIRDAFEAMRRQLKEYVDLRRDEPKQQFTQPHGVIDRLFEDKGYGFIRADDGREIYFHRNALISDDFAALRVGTEVDFSEEAGEQGPQASTVRAYGLSKR